MAKNALDLKSLGSTASAPSPDGKLQKSKDKSGPLDSQQKADLAALASRLGIPLEKLQALSKNKQKRLDQLLNGKGQMDSDMRDRLIAGLLGERPPASKSGANFSGDANSADATASAKSSEKKNGSGAQSATGLAGQPGSTLAETNSAYSLDYSKGVRMEGDVASALQHLVNQEDSVANALSDSSATKSSETLFYRVSSKIDSLEMNERI